MDKKLNLEGCKNLCNAIYAQAANDYILAVVSGNKNLKKETENFLGSGAYFKTRGQGEYIKRKCLEEIKICRTFANDFLELNKDKILINQSGVSLPVLQIVVRFNYKGRLKVYKIKEKMYLIRTN